MHTRQLLNNCKAVVCDLDGTLYLDGIPFAQSVAFLNKVVSSGRKLFYFTNNSSKSKETYINRLKQLEFPIIDDNLITSSDCADNYLKRNKLFPDIYLVANSDLKHDFVKFKFNLIPDHELPKPEYIKAVVLAFDTEITYQKIHNCYNLILADLPYIATHADILCPVTQNTFKPDVGSFISLLKTATYGKSPIVVGKPEREAVDLISNKAELPVEEIVFIGDRLYTDIRMANTYNMKSILVLSGETNIEMVTKSNDNPHLIIENVGDLIPHL